MFHANYVGEGGSCDHGASPLTLFFVKDPVKENLIIVMEQFHQKLMEVKLDNRVMKMYLFSERMLCPTYYSTFDEAYLTSLNNLVINKKLTVSLFGSAN